MAMSTRLRAKKATENNPEPVKLMEGKVQAAKQALMEAKDKRKAFGDLNSRFGSSTSQEEKDKNQKLITAVYKDVKPRVDSRWKKAEVPATRPTKVTATLSVPTVVLSKPVPVLKQTAKPQLGRIAETISMQFKKVTTNNKPLVEVRKDSGSNAVQEPFIKSPGKLLRKEKVENVQKNFYESHSTRLLHQVENIDLNDGDNPQMLAEYVNDIYAYLFKLEKMFPIKENFLAPQVDVTPKMRSVLLDWINEVHNQFSLELETYHMTVSMIDRYLQANSATPRRFLQLVGVTCLFMASKYEELMPPEISDFVYVTDDTYSKDQILQMEKKVFNTLGFNLAKPLPIHFMRRFAKAAGALGDRQYIATKYFMELASIDYEMTKYKPSQIAAASLYLSLHIFNTIKSDKDLWTNTLEYYTTYSTTDLMPVMKRLATLVATAKDTKLKSVFFKYSHTLYKFTSSMPEMNGIKIHEIINRE